MKEHGQLSYSKTAAKQNLAPKARGFR